jgi:membrane protein DedA with SNARE-associated domain
LTDEPEPTEPADAPGDVVAPSPAVHGKIDRRHLLFIIAPIITLVIINYIGNALAPDLVNRNPLLLIAMSPPNRNLIAASHHAPIVLYVIVGFLRLLAPDPFFYALGDNYGERVIQWMERRTPSYGLLMRQLESWFEKASWPLVLILPNNPVCLLAGAAKMDKRIFWSLNAIGTLGRLALMYWIGDVFQDEVDGILGWIAEHRVPLLVLTIGLVGITGLREWLSGTSEIQQLIELEEELEELEGDLED